MQLPFRQAFQGALETQLTNRETEWQLAQDCMQSCSTSHCKENGICNQNEKLTEDLPQIDCPCKMLHFLLVGMTRIGFGQFKELNASPGILKGACGDSDQLKEGLIFFLSENSQLGVQVFICRSIQHGMLNTAAEECVYLNSFLTRAVPLVRDCI